ncbi:hypothetical protein BJX70DRAFT_30457 [Aspergillus crustosus]
MTFLVFRPFLESSCSTYFAGLGLRGTAIALSGCYPAVVITSVILIRDRLLSRPDI